MDFNSIIGKGGPAARIEGFVEAEASSRAGSPKGARRVGSFHSHLGAPFHRPTLYVKTV